MFKPQLILPFAAALFLGAASLAPAPAFARSPLTQPGKTSVFQRVVTHPGAQLFAQASGNQVLMREIKTFTVMYIYGRQGSRLEVGPGSDGPRGWIEASAVTEWPQAITMVFTDRTGRAPVLFFKNRDGLEAACRAASTSATVKSYAAQLTRGALPPDFPVLATEPAATAVSENNFYLMPVLNIDTRYQGLKLVEVASIDPGIGKRGAQNRVMMTEQRMGIALVIDTTISMKPYIDQSLAMVRKLYDELESSPYKDRVAFSVVAFRSSTRRTAGLEYTAKVICDFTPVQDRELLETALAQVKEAAVSTHDINEDSLAGVKEGVDRLSWQNYQGRAMLMVSDAGPLGAGDPDSATGFSPEAMADYLHTNNIYLTALHVRNPASAQNHKYAAEAYRALARQGDSKTSYIPITTNAGQNSFDSTGSILGKYYSRMVKATAEGQLLDAPQTPVRANLSPDEEARRIAESTGYAMQLQFLGNRAEATAPQVVKAWIADADLEKLENNAGSPVLAVEPAVLLTKNQLSNLRKQLKLIAQSSREAFLNGTSDLFGQLRSAAAQMSRDPNQFALNPDRNLAESGLLDEVLADLPYKSSISGLTQKEWEEMSTGKRDALSRRLEGLIARYEEYDRDASHWESFGSPNSGDWVYRVPLSMLP